MFAIVRFYCTVHTVSVTYMCIHVYQQLTSNEIHMRVSRANSRIFAAVFVVLYLVLNAAIRRFVFALNALNSSG